MSQLKFIEKLIDDQNTAAKAIQTIASAVEGIPLDVLADALGQFQSAVYAEQYRLEDIKYKGKVEADQVFGMDGNAGIPN